MTWISADHRCGFPLSTFKVFIVSNGLKHLRIRGGGWQSREIDVWNALGDRIFKAMTNLGASIKKASRSLINPVDSLRRFSSQEMGVSVCVSDDDASKSLRKRSRVLPVRLNTSSQNRNFDLCV